MADDQVTVGELGRNFKALHEHVDKRFDQMTALVASLKFVHQDVYEANRTNDNRRFTDIEEDIREARSLQRSRWEQFVSGFLYPLAVLVVAGLLAYRGLS